MQEKELISHENNNKSAMISRETQVYNWPRIHLMTKSTFALKIQKYLHYWQSLFLFKLNFFKVSKIRNLLYTCVYKCYKNSISAAL
jgi:hypothetical protein